MIFTLFQMIYKYHSIKTSKRLNKDLCSPSAVNLLSQQMRVSTQIEELYRRQLSDPTMQNWFIADLDAETVRMLEGRNVQKTQTDFYLSGIFGRGFSQPFLAKFFVSDKIIISSLRLLSWLTPCPELSCLLLDWSRTSPKAGGLTKILGPLVWHMSRLQLFEARKLACAQSLLSGVVLNNKHEHFDVFNPSKQISTLLVLVHFCV